MRLDEVTGSGCGDERLQVDVRAALDILVEAGIDEVMIEEILDLVHIIDPELRFYRIPRVRVLRCIREHPQTVAVRKDGTVVLGVNIAPEPEDRRG